MDKTAEKDTEFVITAQKKPYFRATMILAGVYAAIIVGLIVIANLPFGKALVGEYYVFTLTIVLGMLVIVLLMMLMLIQNPMKVNPSEKLSFQQAAYSCPDFYKMETTTTDWLDTNIHSSVLNVKKNLLGVKCVPRTSDQFGSNASNLRMVSSNLGDSNAFQISGNFLYVNNAKSASSNLAQYAADNSVFYAATEPEPKCSEIFPQFLQSAEVSYTDPITNKTTYNKDLRCQYAAACGTQWSSLGCPTSI